MTTARLTARPDIAGMAGYHSPQLDVEVRLNTNESPVPPPTELTERLAAALATIDWHRYPDRSATELRAAIGARHGLPPSRVFVANGSNEVLQTLLLAFGGPGRTAAVFEPTYALHGHLSRVSGTAVIEGERGRDFELESDALTRLVRRNRPAVTFLCSPNNPTGVVDPIETTAAALDVVTECEGLLCVDEAYGQFADHSAQELMSETSPLVVTRTYSKTWAMAGLRLGYLLAPEWIVAELDKVVLPYHLDTVKQLAGTIALDYEDDMRARTAELINERARLVERLADLPLDQWPSGANFVLTRPRERSGDDVWRGLVERSVLVRNCGTWPRLDGCLRVTVGTALENDRFVDALSEVLR